MNITGLFGIPIYSDNLEYNFSKELLAQNQLTYDTIAEGNYSISKNNFLLNSPDFLELRDKLEDKIEIYTRNILGVNNSIQFYITTSWIVKFFKDSYANKHIHSNSIFSGVVYLKTPNQCSNIRFHKDTRYNNITSSTLELTFDRYNIFNSDYWEFTPSQGDLYIFPSSLTHSVSKSFSNDERISLAFNVFVKGKFGINEGSLEI